MSGGFEVGASARLRALHRMPWLPPPEGDLHAHDYRIDVVVARDIEERHRQPGNEAVELAPLALELLGILASFDQVAENFLAALGQNTPGLLRIIGVRRNQFVEQLRVFPFREIDAR